MVWKDNNSEKLLAFLEMLLELIVVAMWWNILFNIKLHCAKWNLQ